MLITKMGRKKNLAIAGAAAIGITALVLDTDFNPAAVANAIGAKCETQKEIVTGYGHAKRYYAFIKDLLSGGEKELVEVDVWINRVQTHLFRCYSEEYWKKEEEQRKKYGEQPKLIRV